jgi:hypothetical protein
VALLIYVASLKKGRGENANDAPHVLKAYRQQSQEASSRWSRKKITREPRMHEENRGYDPVFSWRVGISIA